MFFQNSFLVNASLTELRSLETALAFIADQPSDNRESTLSTQANPASEEVMS